MAQAPPGTCARPLGITGRLPPSLVFRAGFIWVIPIELLLRGSGAGTMPLWPQTRFPVLGAQTGAAPPEATGATGAAVGALPSGPMPGRGNVASLAVSSLDCLSYCCPFPAFWRDIEFARRNAATPPEITGWAR
jgi:hypothetical protein